MNYNSTINKMGSIGEFGVAGLLLCNLIFVFMTLWADTHCKDKPDNFDDLTEIQQATYCADIYHFVADDYVDGDPDHNAGRFALLFTVFSGGIYFLHFWHFLQRTVGGMFGVERGEKVYTGDKGAGHVFEKFLLFLFSLVAWALVMQEGGNLPDEYSPSTAYNLLIVIWIFNMLIFMREAALRFYPDHAVSQMIKSNAGSDAFGGGSCRVAEQYPVMGGCA